MNYIIIKLYLNELGGDWHDVNYSDYEKKTVAIHNFAKRHNSRLFISCITNNGIDGPAICGDVFAEVEYTEQLSEEEKKAYIEFLKWMSKDAEFKRGYLVPRDTLSMVSFRRVEREVRLIK